MHARMLDEPIPVGRPLTEDELDKMDVTYRWNLTPYKSRTELLLIITRATHFRIIGGFKPDLIKGL